MRLDQDRLSGWKEIAAFLGKGVRTVQRWEREYALPIHRQGPDGELIFAYRTELEAWVRAGGSRNEAAPSAEAATSRPEVPDTTGLPAQTLPVEVPRLSPGAPVAPPFPWGRPRWAKAFVGASSIALLATLVVSWQAPNPIRASQPSSWRATGDLLHVVDGSGATLWTHRFDFDLHDPHAAVSRPIGAGPVVVEDFDLDGRNEIIVGPPRAIAMADKAIYGFNADGSQRFRFVPADVARFGDESFIGPWLPYKMFVLPARDGAPPQLWVVFIHGMWFPSFAVHLSADGQVLEQHWSPGYIELVQAEHWRGRDWVALGGTNNETRGATLALFATGAGGGTIPAVDQKYSCLTCPPGRPEDLIIFPRRCIEAALNGQPTIRRVWRDETDRLHVEVEEGRRGAYSSAWYTLDAGFSVVEAKFSDEAKATHDLLQGRGVIDHAFNAHGDGSLLPIRRLSPTPASSPSTRNRS